MYARYGSNGDASVSHATATPRPYVYPALGEDTPFIYVFDDMATFILYSGIMHMEIYAISRRRNRSR